MKEHKTLQHEHVSNLLDVKVTNDYAMFSFPPNYITEQNHQCDYNNTMIIIMMMKNTLYTLSIIIFICLFLLLYADTYIQTKCLST